MILGAQGNTAARATVKLNLVINQLLSHIFLATLAHNCGYVRSPPRVDDEVESFNAGRHGGEVDRLRACLRFEKPDIGRLLGRGPELRSNGRKTLRIRDIAETSVPGSTDDPLFEGSLLLSGYALLQKPVTQRISRPSHLRSQQRR